MQANTNNTPVETIRDQMLEPRPLPMGMTEFDEWSDRIISGALLPAMPDSLKFALASMILHLGPTESHKPDAFFIHSLRKSAANQIAHAMMQILKDRNKIRLAEEEEAKKSADPGYAAASLAGDATLARIGINE